MKIRRILNEQNPTAGTNPEGLSAYKNPLIKTAIAAGCFIDKGFSAISDPKIGEGFFKVSKDEKFKSMPNIYILPNADGKTFKVSYRDTNDKEISSRDGIVCGKIEQTTNPVLTPNQQDITDALKASNAFFDYKSVKPDDWSKYTLVNIYNDPDVKETLGNNPYLLSQIQDNSSRVFWMWKGGQNVSGLSAEKLNKGSQAMAAVKVLQNLDYKTQTEITPQELSSGQWVRIDLKNPKDYTGDIANLSYYADFFTTSYPMWKKVDITGPEGAGWDTEEKCRQTVVDYYNKMNTSRPNTTPNTEEKQRVEYCLTKHAGQYPRLRDLILKLITPPRDKSGYAIANGQYFEKAGGKLFGQTFKESKDRLLKNIISENLKKLQLKKKNISEQNVIVKQRLQVLTEGRQIQKKRDLDKFFNAVLVESAYLNSQGYDPTIISENYMDMFKGFVGTTGVDSLFQSFKEYGAKWLLRQFNLDPDSWIGSIFVTTIGNLPIGEIPKLTNCDYAVPLFAKSIVEGMISKFLVGKGLDNPITTLLRNALVELLDDMVFIQKIEGALSKVICPAMSSLTGKFGQVGQRLQQSDNTKELGNKAVDIMSSAKKSTGDMMSTFTNLSKQFSKETSDV
jgi:hypothetical protein